MKVIENYLKKQSIKIERPFTINRYSYPAVDSEGYCVFYEKTTKKCIIHQVKPETCRAGPITFDINPSAGKVEWFLKKRELCIFAPRLYQKREDFKEHFKIAKAEITRLICSIDSKALQAILEVEEPETFKIGETALPQKAAEKLKAAKERK